MTDRLYKAITNVKSKLTDDEVKELMICYRKLVHELNVIYDRVDDSICKTKEVYISILRDVPSELHSLTDILTEIYNNVENLLYETKKDVKDEINDN